MIKLGIFPFVQLLMMSLYAELSKNCWLVGHPNQVKASYKVTTRQTSTLSLNLPQNRQHRIRVIKPLK
jgi:hypothetical protein